MLSGVIVQDRVILGACISIGDQNWKTRHVLMKFVWAFHVFTIFNTNFLFLAWFDLVTMSF